MPLTDKAIGAAKARDRAFKLADEKGLFLLVSPVRRGPEGRASKLWRFKYRFGGKEKLLALGSYPEISLAEARRRRDVAREQVASGKDPSETRKRDRRESKRRSANSFEAVAKDYVDAYSNRWSQAYARDVLHRLISNIFPDLGGRPIAEIEAPELLEVLRKMEARGAHDLAHRMQQLCGQVFRFGVATGRCSRDPAADLKGALTPPKRNHMAAIRPEELPELLRKIDAYDGEPQTRLGLQLLSLTFVRTKELIGAQWIEFDFEKALWTIPSSRMKRVHGVSLDHLVPLASQSIEALHQLKQLNGSGRFVFRGKNAQSHMSNNTLLYALYRLGYHSRMTGHGFRTVASTILNEARERGEHGFGKDVIEKQLAHQERDDVRAAYNRAEYLPQRIQMMQWWANYLASARELGSASALVEAAARSDGGDNRTRDDHANARHRHQSLTGFVFCGQRVDLFREFFDPGLQGPPLRSQHADQAQDARRNISGRVCKNVR
jgi:integrase